MIIPITLAITQTFHPGSLEVQCGKFNDIIKLIMGPQYKEEPQWIGTNDTDKTMITLFVNKETKTWTIVKYDKNDACIVDAGNVSKEINDPVMRMY
jgi:hypothetical protein